MRYVCVLVLLILTSCRSVPTSSEGSVNAEGAQGKGGTITCGEGFTSAPQPDGSVVPTCSRNFIWADPPSAEETQGVLKGVEMVMAPFKILAEALARLVPGAN